MQHFSGHRELCLLQEYQHTGAHGVAVSIPEVHGVTTVSTTQKCTDDGI